MKFYSQPGQFSFLFRFVVGDALVGSGQSARASYCRNEIKISLNRTFIMSGMAADSCLWSIASRHYSIHVKLLRRGSDFQFYIFIISVPFCSPSSAFILSSLRSPFSRSISLSLPFLFLLRRKSELNRRDGHFAHPR